MDESKNSETYLQQKLFLLGVAIYIIKFNRHPKSLLSQLKCD